MSTAGTPIRVVFLGSPDFAVPSLNSLVGAADIDVELVITQPDRRAGRGKSLTSPQVKNAAVENHVPVLQPETLRDPAIVSRIRETEPDLIVVVSYGEILRRELLNLAPGGCINVHPSLLPAYRGAIPIQATILNGDQRGGVTFIKLIRAMDAGPIIHQIPIELTQSETAGELFDQLGLITAEALPDVVVRWMTGTCEAREQDHESATYTRELRKADAQLNWTDSAVDIERFVRAMNPWPKAWSTIAEQRVSVERVSVVPASQSERSPGHLDVDHEGWPVVDTRNGQVRIEHLTPAGKKQVRGDDWLRGASNLIGECFDQITHQPERLIFRR